MKGFFINRATCSQAVSSFVEKKRSGSVSSELSQHSRDENRKLIQETFDIEKKEDKKIRISFYINAYDPTYVLC